MQHQASLDEVGRTKLNRIAHVREEIKNETKRLKLINQLLDMRKVTYPPWSPPVPPSLPPGAMDR